MRRIGELPDNFDEPGGPTTPKLKAFRMPVSHNLEEGDIMVLANKEWNQFLLVHYVKDGPNDLHQEGWFQLKAGDILVREKNGAPMYFHLKHEWLMSKQFAVDNKFDVKVDESVISTLALNFWDRYERFVKKRLNVRETRYVECCGLELVRKERSIHEPHLDTIHTDRNLRFLTQIIVKNDNLLAQRASVVNMAQGKTIWYQMSGETEMRHNHVMNPWLFPAEPALSLDDVEFHFNEASLTIYPETPKYVDSRGKRQKVPAEPVKEEEDRADNGRVSHKRGRDPVPRSTINSKPEAAKKARKIEDPVALNPPKKRGRPLGSKNKKTLPPSTRKSTRLTGPRTRSMTRASSEARPQTGAPERKRAASVTRVWIPIQGVASRTRSLSRA